MKSKSVKNYAAEWKSVILGQMASVLTLLEQQEIDPHTAVHETRKAFKRIRAALRMIRTVDEEAFRTLNIYFRDEARKIADLRDATSILEGLDELEKVYGEGLRDDVFLGIRDDLEIRRERIKLETIHKNKALASIYKALKKEYASLEGWDPGFIGREDLMKGVRKIYKQGVRAFEKAEKKGDSFHYHEWRKKVKYLMNMLSLFPGLCPGWTEERQGYIDTLSGLLGSEHDLVITRDILEKEKIGAGKFPALDIFWALSGHEQERLKEEAHRLGKDLYSGSPKKFILSICEVA